MAAGRSPRKAEAVNDELRRFPHRSDAQLHDDIESMRRTARHARTDRQLGVALELETLADQREQELTRRSAVSS